MVMGDKYVLMVLFMRDNISMVIDKDKVIGNLQMEDHMMEHILKIMCMAIV